jgi:hypothetical protein
LPLAAGQTLAYLADLAVEHASVHFELGLARPASHADAASLALKVAPGPDEPGRLMLKSGQLDLQFPLRTSGALAKDFEDQFSSIEHPEFPGTLEIALLYRRDLVVKEDQIDAQTLDELSEFFDLAPAEV